MVYVTLYLLSAAILLFFNLKLFKMLISRDLDTYEIASTTFLSLLPMVNVGVLVMILVSHFLKFLHGFIDCRIDWGRVVKFVNNIV